jgi:hypothetical protein
MKIIVTILFIVFFISLPATAAEREKVYSQFDDDTLLDLSRMYIPLGRSIEVINASTGAKEYLDFHDQYKLSVKGSVNGMYEVDVIKNGLVLKDTYLTAPQNITTGVNWSAVRGIVSDLDQIKKGAVVDLECNIAQSISVRPGTSAPNSPPSSRSPASEKKSDGYSKVKGSQREIYVEPTPGEFHEGCEALADQPIQEQESKDKLAKCINSIKQAITSGNYDDKGNLIRTKVFASMYERLKPEEQIFAAYMFTALGEAGVWSKDIEKPGEAMLVMKSIQNRRNAAIEQGASANSEEFNELDIVLTEFQYSMYNPGLTPGTHWSQYMNPDDNSDFSVMIEAFAQMTDPNTQWEPDDVINEVTHYHREYLKPAENWEKNGVRVYPTVNGQKIRSDSSSNGYNKIYYNVDGAVNWAYVESRETFRP